MSRAFRRLMQLRSLVKKTRPEPDEIIQEKWTADFSREKHARFDIKSESSYDANLRKNLFYSGHSLVLSLKKTGCMAWVEAPACRYQDLIISGAIRIDTRGGYGAGGMCFRMMDSETYYSLLISSRGYFRLDAVRNGMPFPLAGWTELPLNIGPPGREDSLAGPTKLLFESRADAALRSDRSVDFSIVAYGSHILIFLQGRWAAELNDSSIMEGTIGFTAVSYEGGDPAYKVIREANDEKDLSCTTEVFLESLTVDSRITEVSALYEKWRDSPDIDPRARLNLAETFTAMNQHEAAMVQLRKSWETTGHRKTQRELLLAGRLSQQLGFLTDAESYIGKCFEADVESPEGKEALVEMAKILYTGERFGELKDYCAEAVKIKPDDPILLTFQGHAYWNLNDHKKAAAAYDKAFSLDKGNGISAKNAANVYDVMGRKKDALYRYLEAGRVFLNSSNYNDLGLIVPQLLALGGDNWEARSLAGKWAFAVEDWKLAEAEFKKAEELRKTRRPKPKKDGAQVFLEALLLIRAGKRREALPLLLEAVELEKEYPLFHFRLAENLFLLGDDSQEPRMLREMNAALVLTEKDTLEEKDFLLGNKSLRDKENEGLAGWVNNFAAQVALKRGNLDAAAKYLEKAEEVLGEIPAVRVNRGVLFYLKGTPEKAMKLLEADRQSDPDGIMANCAGNLLVRSGRFEEADEKYRQALALQGDNVEYLCNRSSCLIKLARYGEADELLARAHTIAPGPALLEMISYVAAKKGEYARAEQACRSALEIDPFHAPSLLSLGWVLLTLGRQEEAGEIIRRLDELELGEDTAKGREDLKTRLDDLVYKTIECVSCERHWKVRRDPPPAPAIRLYAMPPDDLPAGSCPDCGKTYCIGCAKSNLDPNGRFICPSCNKSLRLTNEGLKQIIHDWAAEDGLLKTKKKTGKKKADSKTKGSAAGSEKRIRNKQEKNEQASSPLQAEPSIKRGRAKPGKTGKE